MKKKNAYLDSRQIPQGIGHHHDITPRPTALQKKAGPAPAPARSAARATLPRRHSQPAPAATASHFLPLPTCYAKTWTTPSGFEAWELRLSRGPDQKELLEQVQGLWIERHG